MRKTLEREVTDALQRQGSSLMETLYLGSNHRRSKREFLKNVERETIQITVLGEEFCICRMCWWWSRINGRETRNSAGTGLG